jgi:2'-5' RNA ligase
VKQRERTFVGIRCGAAIRRRFHAHASALARGDPALKVPAIEDLHITVQFLGLTPQEDLAPIGHALQAVAAGFAPFEVRYPSLGAFPDAQRPRVLWAGVEEPDGGDALPRLAKAVGAALRDLGYRPERRAFHAHVTLARGHRRPTEAVFRALASPRATDFGSEILSELKLILSDPAHRPYHYIDLTTAELGSAGS